MISTKISQKFYNIYTVTFLWLKLSFVLFKLNTSQDICKSPKIRLRNSRETLENRSEEQLRIACSNNNLDLVKQLIVKFNLNVNQVFVDDAHENSLLHYTAQHGRLKMCKLLLDNNADPNKLNRLEQSPLHLAVKEDKLDCAELLIYHGANPYLADKQGLLPHQYSPHPAKQIKKLLLKMEVNPVVNNVHLNSLHSMAINGNIFYLKHLLSRNANPNKLNKNGVTPLHLAMLNNQLESVDILAGYGASINNLGNVKLTPLDLFLGYIILNNNQTLINEAVKRLTHGWKLSSPNTFLLLLNGNLQNLMNIHLEPEIEDNTSNGQIDVVKLFDDLKSIKIFILFINSSFSKGINILKEVFIKQKKNEVDFESNNLCFIITQIFRSILSFTAKILKLKFDNDSLKFEQIFGQSLLTFDIQIIRLLFDFIFDIIKSGELLNSRIFCYDMITTWFYENYSLNNVTTQQHDKAYDYCYEYFDNLMGKLYEILSSRPLSLQDICRIKIKYGLKNYPQDLDTFEFSMHNSLLKFLKFSNEF
jgi:ankyrin repeat protein